MRHTIRSTVTTALAAALAVVAATWLMRETIPVEMTGIYFLGTHVEQGGTASFRLVGEKYRNCPAIVAEEIIDSTGNVFRLPPRIGGITETGSFDNTISVPVPYEAAEGRATFRSRASYGIDFMSFCFRPYIVGPPKRPEVKFWIGKEKPSWMKGTSQ